MTATLKPGIYRDVDFDTYLSLDAISNSSLHAAKKSMLHYLTQKTVEETPAMRLGTLCHAGKFEPEMVSRRYAVMPAFENDVRQKKIAYTRANSDFFRTMTNGLSANGMSETSWLNMQASMTLVDHFVESREGFAGIEKGSSPQPGMARVIQYISKARSWDGVISFFSREGRGAVLAAERAQEFSENLSRAPHVAGFIKMALFALFPWLCFFVIAGRWKVLLYWYAIYASVLIWTPIWTLLYHVMLGISLSTETMAALGKLNDGFSLYSASLVSSKMNYMFAVYSWLQLLIGATFTGSLLWFLKPVLSDSETESAPEFIDDAKSAAQNMAKSL